MNTRLIKILQQVEKLLQQAPNIEPGWASKDECYQWVEATLQHFRYPAINRADKGIIRRYLRVVTGYSRAQVSRLIKTYHYWWPEASTADNQWLQTEIHTGG